MVRLRGNAKFTFLPVILICSLVAASLFTVFPRGIVYVAQPPTADVALEPARVEDIFPPDEFTVDLTVVDAEDIQSWEANVTFDPAVLEVVTCAEGEFLKRKGLPTNFFSDIRLERVLLSATYLMIGPPGSGVTGDGTLGNITFRVKARGSTSIHLDEEYTNLYYNDGTPPPKLQPCVLHDGFFHNLHDVAVTSVTAFPTEVNLGDSVSIDVTVANEGSFTETFTVTTYWKLGVNQQEIDTKTVVDLENGTDTTLPFDWNTADVPSTGIYTIFANATEVPFEIDIADNTRVFDGGVRVSSGEAPVANFTYYPKPVLVNQDVTFDAQGSSDPNGHIVSWDWNFGDGTTGTGEVTTHQFTQDGDYEVTLTVTDNQTLRNTAYETITVLAPPVASFTWNPKPALVNQDVTFDASASTPNGGTIISYEWDFGDSNKTKVVKFNSDEQYVDFDNTGRYNAGDPVYKDINQTVPNRVDPGDLRLTSVTWWDRTGSYPANSTVKPTDKDVGNTTHLFSNGGHRENVLENGEYDIEEVIRLDWRVEKYAYATIGTFTVTLTVADSEGMSSFFSDNVTVSTKRDIVVVSATCYRPNVLIEPREWAYVGETLNISIPVRNKGTQPETFNLTVHYEGPSTGTLTREVVNLPPADQAPHNEKKVGVFWDTTPISAGNYTITVEAVLDGDQNPTDNNATTEIEMNIPPDVAVTDVMVSPTTALAGDLLNITVLIKNEGTSTEDCTVQIYFSNGTHPKISPEGLVDRNQGQNIRPSEERAIYFNWNLTERQLQAARLNISSICPGIYTLSAEVPKISVYEFDLDDNLHVYGDVTIGASLLSIHTPKTTVSVGSTTTINGSITPTRRNATVTIWHKLAEDETWAILETLATDENSTYVYDWRPEDTGTYQLKATWLGDNLTFADESNVLEITVRQAQPGLELYIVAGIAIIGVAAVAVYFLKIRKPTQ